jgi:hypothetical protein
MAWKGIVGKPLTADEFDAHVYTLTWASWRPQFIVLHNTAVPSLAQRPDGFTAQHIRNLEAYYRDQQGWSGGPHLFIDDKRIWLFTPLTVSGVHSPSWNSKSIGIEMLGDYARESFTAGRGLLVRRNAVRAISALSRRLGYAADGWKFHVEDKASDHDCPGPLARKERSKLVQEIAALMKGDKPANPDQSPPPWGVILPDDKE